ncbi:hypothetical protein GGX14DRAFT_566908 [Mycena pura]|uniref:Uncharacterized protein n=1 Tax=Mycena pura TaxID=153505 RepID=A0AAD6VBC5_9AGAR|nr:hypothetical protein GGX14DRAFT_566908 [Mycena pura]
MSYLNPGHMPAWLYSSTRSFALWACLGLLVVCRKCYLNKEGKDGVCVFRQRKTVEQGHRDLRLSSFGILLMKYTHIRHELALMQSLSALVTDERFTVTTQVAELQKLMISIKVWLIRCAMCEKKVRLGLFLHSPPGSTACSACAAAAVVTGFVGPVEQNSDFGKERGPLLPSPQTSVKFYATAPRLPPLSCPVFGLQRRRRQPERTTPACCAHRYAAVQWIDEPTGACTRMQKRRGYAAVQRMLAAVEVHVSVVRGLGREGEGASTLGV